jgi:Sec-independent protein translocase protein TatA
MEILGIGPMEMLLILIIALIVMGPNDMVKTGRTVGKFLRTVVKSPIWQAVQQTSRDLRYLPNKLMREAGMEEEVEQLKEIGKNVNAMGSMQTSLKDEISKVNQEIMQTGKDLSAWTTTPAAADPEASPAPIEETASEPVIKPPESGASAAADNAPAASQTSPTDHSA